tara:strand:- start:1328 stop:1705 length:378 start_codon:yes stop_codon:yes gene_type:complete
MIDTDKYEGHTQGPWKASHDVVEYGHIVNNTGWRVYVGEHEKRAEIQNYRFDHDELSEANARLIADAPLLLEEVRRLRDIVCLLEDSRITNMSIHDRPQLFADVAEVFRQRNEDTHGHLPNFGEE